MDKFFGLPGHELSHRGQVFSHVHLFPCCSVFTLIFVSRILVHVFLKWAQSLEFYNTLCFAQQNFKYEIFNKINLSVMGGWLFYNWVDNSYKDVSIPTIKPWFWMSHLPRTTIPVWTSFLPKLSIVLSINTVFFFLFIFMANIACTHSCLSFCGSCLIPFSLIATNYLFFGFWNFG